MSPGRNPKRQYWQANPDARGLISPEKTPKHEALHTAAAICLGYEARRIIINKDGSGAAFNESSPNIRWHRTAIALAPALVDDLCSTDVNYMGNVNPRSRGYAWGWLKRNKTKIMRKANFIVALMGKPGGRLLWNDDGSVEWRPRKRVKRK